MAQDGREGRHLVHGRGEPLGQQEEGDPEQRDEHIACRCGDHLPERQVPEQGTQPVPPVEHPRPAAHRDRPAVLGRGLGMVDDGVGDHPHPVARGVHPPAEVDIVHEQAHGGIEPADLLPDIAADQHPRAAYREGVPVAVVLALVDLAGLDPGNPPGGRVQGQPGLEDHLAVGPVPELRAEYRSRARLGRAAEQLLERVRRWLAVIMKQPEPLDPVPGAPL